MQVTGCYEDRQRLFLFDFSCVSLLARHEILRSSVDG